MTGASSPGTGQARTEDFNKVPPNPIRVLVVEDTDDIATLIRIALEADGMTVRRAADLGGARQWLAADPPDVMVVDVHLPDGSGLDLLRKQATSSPVPVVALSSSDGEMDRVLGLELGADDYMVKPFFPRELAARVRRAATRQPGKSRRVRVLLDGLLIDLDSREVAVDGAPVSLTMREFDLLAHLAASPRTVFSRHDLLRDVWGSSPEWQSAATVTEHVRRLRQKIEPDPSRPQRIVTVGRAGYRLEPRIERQTRS